MSSLLVLNVGMAVLGELAMPFVLSIPARFGFPCTHRSPPRPSILPLATCHRTHPRPGAQPSLASRPPSPLSDPSTLRFAFRHFHACKQQITRATQPGQPCQHCQPLPSPGSLTISTAYPSPGHPTEGYLLYRLAGGHGMKGSLVSCVHLLHPSRLTSSRQAEPTPWI